MASIEKTGNGYRVRWRDPDGAERSRACPTREAAQRLRREVESDVALGRRWEPRDARAAPDLRLMLRDYVIECTRVLSRQTAIRYARAIDLYLRWLVAKVGANRPLEPTLLSRRLLADWYESLAHGGLHGRDRSLATRRKLVEVVQLAWAWLYDDEEWGDHVAPPRRLRMPREPAAATVAPTWEEMDACLAALRNWQQRECLVQRFTGLRVQQVMRLRCDDLDIEQGLLCLRGELGKSKQERRGRVVPVSEHLVEIVRGWDREQDDDWLIQSARKRGGDRERMARARDVTRGWERAGVREAAWRGRPHHAFRKGFVSGLKRAGADADAVEFLVGHSLGLRGVYIDPEALPLRDTVDRVPPLDPALAADIAARCGVQARFGALDPQDTRPMREIMLDDASRRRRLRAWAANEAVRRPEDTHAQCRPRVQRTHPSQENVVFLDSYKKNGGGGGSRTRVRKGLTETSTRVANRFEFRGVGSRWQDPPSLSPVLSHPTSPGARK